MKTIDSENFLNNLEKRYSNIHPLIFHRSIEKANTPGELFDILEEFPNKYPLMWSEEDRRWIETNDLVQVKKFDLGMGKK